MGVAGSRLLTWGCYAYSLRLVPGLWPMLRAANPILRHRLRRWAALVAAFLALGASNGKNRIVQLINSDEWQIFSVPVMSVVTLAAAALRRRGAMRNLLQFVVIYGSIPTFVHAIRDFMGPERGEDVDIVALVAILLGVLRNQDAASLMILLMVTGGEALEHIAVKRAKVSLEGLLAKKPCSAHQVIEGGSGPSSDHNMAVPLSSPMTMRIQTVPVDKVCVGDLIQVRNSEMFPLDGVVERGECEVDDSNLTGEKRPSRRNTGDTILSGSLNVSAGAVLIRATKPAAEGTFQLISARLEQCLDTKAAFEDTTLHYASLFTPFAFALATFGYARTAGNWDTALSVLMAATPCPLSIGCPVAFLAGMSVAAKSGITVKNRAALESAAQVTTLVLDKTGTLTEGCPSVRQVCPRLDHALRSSAEQKASRLFALQLVASVESNSSHPLAKAIVAYAEKDLGITELFPLENVHEVPGHGIKATVLVDASGKLHASTSSSTRHDVAVGTRSFVMGGKENLRSAMDVDAPGMPSEAEQLLSAEMVVYVSIDGELWGHLRLSDAIRCEAAAVLAQVRRMGIKNIVILTGDSSGDADRVGKALGITDVQVCLPLEKVAAVERLKAAGERVLMIGDGVNDAPALQAAHVGVSLGVSDLVSEGANVIFLQNSLKQLPQLICLGQSVLQVAQLGVNGGMSVSLLQMCLAASGMVPPFVNACMQEVVDLSAILNSLRVLSTDLKHIN